MQANSSKAYKPLVLASVKQAQASWPQGVEPRTRNISVNYD